VTVAAEVGLYVPIVLVAFVVFLLFMVRARPRSRQRLEEGGGQRADYEG
jgi:TfoX/Sxy family transcriptional regulator of competence genes